MLKRCFLKLSARTARDFVDSRSILVTLLRDCGAPAAALTATDPDFVKSSPRNAEFAPLLESGFHFLNRHLTARGDTIIADYLTNALTDYFLHTGIVMTSSGSRQLLSVFHSHAALRLLAKENRLEELSSPLTSAAAAFGLGTREMNATDLGFLEPHRRSVSRHDTLGTSFATSPLASGHSPLAWKLSHLVAATHARFGVEVSDALLQRLYDLRGNGNLPHRAAQFLLRTAQTFPAAHVAESILAAQGLPVRYTARTRYLGPDVGTTGASEDAADDPTSPGTTSSAPSIAVFAFDGFQSQRDDGVESSDVADTTASLVGKTTLDTLAEAAAKGTPLPSAVGADNIAAGPGGVPCVEQWRARSAALSALVPTEPPLHEVMDEGFLTPQEVAKFARGPAHEHSVRFDGGAAALFADTYGPPQPEEGKVVARRHFKKDVRDPLFYDKRSDLRNGLPLPSVHKEYFGDYLHSFSRPHHRLFEVTLHAGGINGGRRIGSCISTHYTLARESVCHAFIGGVLTDLENISSSSQQGSA